MAVKKTKLKTKKESGLSIKQELFCYYYAVNTETFDNATMSYAMAYGYTHLADECPPAPKFDDKTGKKEEPTEEYLQWQRDYATCQTEGRRNLLKPLIDERVGELLREHLSAKTLDKELSWVAQQRRDLPSKMRAISEGNKLKQRIEEKVKVEHTIIPKEELDKRLNQVKPKAV